MIGIGFIGVGDMGRMQVKAFQKLDDCQVVAASDPSESSLAKFKELCPDAKTFSDHKELLAEPSVDAVVIAVPTALHEPLATDALASGRAVLVEKPMARTVEQAKCMIDAAQKANKLLMVAHCRRFDTDWGTFAKAYRGGKLGEPVLWRHMNAGVGPTGWFRDEKLGGGPLMDGAVHNQDFANMLFGEAEDVVGHGIKFDPDVTAIDTGSVIVRYRNGCQLLLSWSWAVRGAGAHDVLGMKSSLVFGSGDMSVPEGCGGHTLIDPQGEKHLLTFERQDMYVNQARHFVDRVAAGETTCDSPGTEAIKGVATAEAALKAMRTGKPCPV